MKKFINELKENRIELWVEEGELHYKAPKGAMTKEIIDKIKKNKYEIINFLYNDICLRLERAMIKKGGINNALAERDLSNNSVVLYLEPEDSKSTIENYYIDKIAITCEECWKRETLKLNRTLLQEWIDLAEQLALGEMFKLFLEHDIFVSTETIYTYDIMENKLGVTDKYKRFLRRWLKIFEKEGYIVYNGTGYVCIKQDNPNVQELWKMYWSKENKLNYGKEFVDYLEKCSKNLSNLFSGQVTPLELLFPQGKSDVAVGTYQNTLSSKILNHMAEDAILSSYMYRKNINEIFRILEVGAGVGGTSDGVIEKLDGKNVEYFYTDVSNYFLNNARKRYEGKDWIQYQIFDINKGSTEGTMYDLILCANVLHNAKNGIEILTMLKSKLKDEGIMVIIDAIKEPYYLLTSIEFNDGLRDFEDFRNYNDETFFNKKQWNEMFQAVGGNIIVAYPEDDDVFFGLGQGIFVVSFTNKKINLDIDHIMTYLKLYFENNELPNDIRVLNYINKKINKETGKYKSLTEEQEPMNEIEKKIENIWCDSLNKQKIAREENFFMIGGDSLLLSQVIAQMWENIPESKEFEWSELMKQMLASPTIAGISEYIMTAKKPIQKYTTFIEGQDTDIVYVLFHAGMGLLTPYIELINELRKNGFRHKIIGISCQNFHEYLSISPKCLYYTLAQNYAEILHEFEKKNLYFIGHCIGGILALETANVLKGRGIDVRKVTMISTNICQDVFDDMYVNAYADDIILEKVFGRLIGSDVEKIGYVINDYALKKEIEDIIRENGGIFDHELLGKTEGEIDKQYKELLKYSQKERLRKLYLSSNMKSSEIADNQIIDIYQIFKHNFIAAIYYKPNLYNGDVSILKCDTETDNFFINIIEKFSESEDVWNNSLTGEVSVFVINGNHITCMEQPNIKRNINYIIGENSD